VDAIATWISDFLNPVVTKIFCSSPQHAEQVLDPSGLLFSGYRGYFPVIKQPGRDVYHLHPSSTEINPLKTKCVCFIQGLRAYRAVNTLHFGYKYQSLNFLYGKSFCLF
jgi:hypothetical protein